MKLRLLERLRLAIRGEVTETDVKRLLGERYVMTATGIRVTAETALRVSAVKACVRVLAEAIASLPVRIYRRLDDGGKEPATDHPLYSLLATKANYFQTGFRFREFQVAHQLLRGAGYALKNEVRGNIVELLPIHPDRIKLNVAKGGAISFEITRDDGSQFEVPQDRVLHLPGLSSDGFRGRSVIQDHRETLALAVAQEMFGAKSYGNGGTKRVVLEHPGVLSEGARSNMVKSWKENYGGIEALHLPLVAEEGTKVKEISMTAEDLEYIESRRFSIAEIARIFGVPLHLIGELDRSTNNNIEMQELEFVIHTLRPWCVRWEQDLDMQLLKGDPKYFFRFSLDGLLRGNTKDRYAAYAVGRQWGFLSANDIRALEDMNGIGPEGDRYLEPTNMVKAGDQPDTQPADDPSKVSALATAFRVFVPKNGHKRGVHP